MDMNFEDWVPAKDQSAADYAAQLQKEGHRELALRKALRFHFDMSIPDVIALCAEYPMARLREITDLRARFDTLSEKRFAFQIKKSMTLTPEEAAKWAHKIFSTESEVGA